MRLLPAFAGLCLCAALPARAQEDPAGTGNPFDQGKFVPDISLILDCSWLHRNVSNGGMEELFIPGLVHAHGGADHGGHEHGEGRRGFNLNYAELVMASAVDPYFDLCGVFHLAEEGFGIEEAYFTTRRLPAGFRLRGGKFLSGFGRINEQHAHNWDFAGAPLAYSAFFGDEMLNELGLRLTWVPPLDWYLVAGAEILQGSNETSFGSGGFADPSGLTAVGESRHPDLAVGYLRGSADIGEAALLAGVSAAFGKTRRDDGFSGEGDGHAVDGSTAILAGDLTLRYPMGPWQYLALQGEFLHRSTDGTRLEKSAAGAVTLAGLETRQGGLYAQFTARLSREWRGGVRVDLLPLNTVRVDGMKEDLPQDLSRWAFMAEYNPTEFSRLRLQYDLDRSRFEPSPSGGSPQRKTVHQVRLQASITIGAHGAHAF
ncbi:MAG: hypothetical protein WB626_04815 [Bacteroidota bacterium]